MNELIKVVVENNRQTVLGRDLHEFLEVITPYHKWFPRMCEYGFTENMDFMTVDKNVLRADGIEMPQIQYDHQLTLEMAKEISMIQRTEKGKIARLYFIDCERKLKSILPFNYLEALKSLVQSEEEKLILKAENENNKILIEEMKPKVEFTDTLLKSKDNLLVREYSKILQDNGFTLGQNKLYEWLRSNKYLMQNNEPYQNYMKYFVVNEVAINTQYGVKLNKTTKINPDGQLYLYKKLKQDGMFNQ